MVIPHVTSHHILLYIISTNTREEIVAEVEAGYSTIVFFFSLHRFSELYSSTVPPITKQNGVVVSSFIYPFIILLSGFNDPVKNFDQKFLTLSTNCAVQFLIFFMESQMS